jgi:S1-C subfamily serine protease
VLSDPSVSRIHAMIWEQQDKFYVRDENSRNGTFVGETRIAANTPTLLSIGDQLRVGNVTLSVIASQETIISTPPQLTPPTPRGALPPAQPAKSKTPLILGCIALLIFGIIGICALSLGGLILLGGNSGTPTPLAARSFATLTPAIQTPIVKPPVTATSASTSASDPLRIALAGSVFILTPDDSGKPLSSGSGTVLTPQGHILTNFHVIGDIATGKFLNKQSLVYIGISPPELNAKPNILYLAKIIKSDKGLDLALLRIVANQNGGPLPADLKLTPVPVGDSDKVQIGDEVTVIGFPSLGEGTVTLTKGSVSGFLDDAESVGTWIKTDAEINRGNSGGTAITKAGELIGIPTAVRYDTQVSGKIGKIRPVNFAKSFIQFAQQDAKSPVTFTFTPWSTSATRVPTTAASAATFAQIVICDEVKDGKPVNPRATFPAGTKKVTAYWTFKGMTNGQEWGRRWVRNSQVLVDKLSQQWNDDESGWTSVFLSDESGTALDPGSYEFRLFLGKTEVQKAAFTIQPAGGAAPTVAPQTGGTFGKIVVAESVTDAGETINPSNTFPSGTRTIWVYFTYLNMKNGDTWSRKWLHDGTVLLEKNETWTKGATGWQAFSYGTTDGSPLVAGTYEFVLYLGSKEVQRAAFTIRK